LRPGSRPRAFLWLAALWGLAEATLFFIVPDVLISILALRSLRRAIIAALAAALAATMGGLLVWTCASRFPDETLQVLLSVPGISSATLETAQGLLQKGLFQGLLVGAFSGVPYKVLASEAAFASATPGALFLASSAARLPRFVLVALIAWSLSRLVGNSLSDRSKLALCFAVWLVFYTAYFLHFGW